MKEIYIHSGELVIGPVILMKHDFLEKNAKVLFEGKTLTLISFKYTKLEWIGEKSYSLIHK